MYSKISSRRAADKLPALGIKKHHTGAALKGSCGAVEVSRAPCAQQPGCSPPAPKVVPPGSCLRSGFLLWVRGTDEGGPGLQGKSSVATAPCRQALSRSQGEWVGGQPRVCGSTLCTGPWDSRTQTSDAIQLVLLFVGCWGRLGVAPLKRPVCRFSIGQLARWLEHATAVTQTNLDRWK